MPVYLRPGWSGVLWFVVLQLFLVGCTFEPEDQFTIVDNEPAVELTDAWMKRQDLLELPDTFALYAQFTSLSFALTFEKADTARVEIFIDNVRYKISGSSGEFTFDAAKYANGFHELRLEAYTNTGTGSVADQFGAEGLRWTLIKTFSVQRINPDPLTVTRIYAEDGRLVVEWEPSAVPTEKIVEIFWSNNINASRRWQYTISDPQQTKLVDPFFIEGKCSVKLTNRSIDPVIPSPITTSIVSFDPPPILSYTFDGTGKTTVVSQRSLFYRNVAFYILKYDNKIIARSKGERDTVLVTSSIPFWGPKWVTLQAVARTLPAKEDTFDDQDTLKSYFQGPVMMGESIPSGIPQAVYAPLHPEIGFGTDYLNDKLLVLEGDQVVQTVSVSAPRNITADNIGVSNDGAYLYYPNDGKVMRMDRAGNATMVLDTEAVYGVKIVIGNLALGGDRYLCFDNVMPSASQRRQSYVFDLVDGVKLFDRTDPDLIYNLTGITSIRISPDGQYLALCDDNNIELYGITAGVVTYVKTLAVRAESYLFDTANDNALLIGSDTDLKRYDFISGQLETLSIAGHTITGVDKFCYDPVTGLIGYNTREFYHVIDVENRTLVRKIALVLSYPATFNFYNGALYKDKYRYDFQLQ